MTGTLLSRVIKPAEEIPMRISALRPLRGEEKLVA
jgi:hypothetical protein